MKPVTFRPKESVQRLLEAELKARPGVSLSYVINEKITAGFGRSDSKSGAVRRPTKLQAAA
jgi:hypothetical protein